MPMHSSTFMSQFQQQHQVVYFVCYLESEEYLMKMKHIFCLLQSSLYLFQLNSRTNERQMSVYRNIFNFIKRFTNILHMTHIVWKERQQRSHTQRYENNTKGCFKNPSVWSLSIRSGRMTFPFAPGWYVSYIQSLSLFTLCLSSVANKVLSIAG